MHAPMGDATDRQRDAPIVAMGRRVFVGQVGDENLEGQLGKGSRRRDGQVLALNQIPDFTEQAFVKCMGPCSIEGQRLASLPILI